MKERYNNELIFFLHIQKTAGMTLQELLRRNLGRSPLRILRDFITGDTGEGFSTRQALQRIMPGDRLFMGHFGYGVHNLVPRPFSYVTFLREPVRRLVSLYHYSKLDSRAFYHKYARERSIGDFLLDCPLHELDNGMTRQIAGDDKNLFMNRVPYGSCGQELLDKAIANIERDFLFVGIQERFMESVFLLSKTLRFNHPYFLTFNRGRRSQASEDKALTQRLREKNALDLALYEMYRERFDQEFMSFIQDHPGGLETFVCENQKQQIYLRRRYMVRLRARRLLESLLRRPTSARPMPV
jgi:hypothetical protein